MSQSIIMLIIAILGQYVPLAKRLCWCPNPTLPEYLNSEMLFSYGRGALLNSSIAMRLWKTWIGQLTDKNRQFDGFIFTLTQVSFPTVCTLTNYVTSCCIIGQLTIKYKAIKTTGAEQDVINESIPSGSYVTYIFTHLFNDTPLLHMRGTDSRRGKSVPSTI